MQAKVKVEPIYKSDSGLLNGSGYFYVPQPSKTSLNERTMTNKERLL